MITEFTVSTAVIWLNLGMLAMLFLRKNRAFYLRHSTTILVWLAAVALARLLLPLELPWTYVVRSYEVYPAVQDSMTVPLLFGLSFNHLLLALWALGSLAVVLREVGRIFRQRRRLRDLELADSEQLARIAEELGLERERVHGTTDLINPVTVGWRRPEIYVPLIPCTDEQLRWVLRHEKAHMTRGDNWFKLFYFALRVLFWWNPICCLFQSELDSILEMRCDQYVLRDCSGKERLEYSRTLLHVAEQIHPELACLPVGTNGFACKAKPKLLAQRIQLILRKPKDYRASTVLIVVLILVIFVASYSFVIQPASFASEEDIPGAVSVSSDDMYLIKREDGLYMLWYEGHLEGPLTEEVILIPPFCDLEIVEEGAGEE